MLFLAGAGGAVNVGVDCALRKGHGQNAGKVRIRCIAPPIRDLQPGAVVFGGRYVERSGWGSIQNFEWRHGARRYFMLHGFGGADNLEQA